EGVTPSVVYMTVEMEKQYSLDDNTIMKSFPPLSTSVTTMAGNAPGKSSYANITGKPSRKKLNFHTLFTPRGNRIDVVVPVESIRAISARFANAAYGFFFGNSSTGLFSFQFSSMGGLDSMLENGSWSSYVRAMIELRVDVELKDKIVVNMPKTVGEGHYTCNIRVEYEWKPPRCTSCPKVGFKPHKEYRPVPKKPNASSSGNKKKCVEPNIEVSNSNPFDVLNSVDNDVELGTN
ncbi:hypothetical protein Tco_1128306, partial [Tanacetum coccineum]